MYEFRRDGVTIIFVSHNLSLVTKFCTKGIFIHEGKLAFIGNVSDCVDHYIYHKYGAAAQSGSKRWGSMGGTIESIRILNVNGKETAYLKTGDPISIVVEYRNGSGVKDPVMGIAIINEDNNRVYGINTTQSEREVTWRNEGKIVFSIPTLSLAEGTYLLTVALHDKNPHIIYDWHDKAHILEVITAKEFAGSYDLECRMEGF
jgi:lipopolysaccharide transport system ATP-binding protein